MTNLFTHLAARSLGLTPIVQPRIDSMFSPRLAVEPIDSASLSEFNQPEFNRTNLHERNLHERNAIVQSSRREGATAAPLVNPTVNRAVNPATHQTFPPLSIAHMPRPGASETGTAQTNDRSNDEILDRDSSAQKQPVSNERSVDSDILEANAKTNLDTSTETNLEINIETNRGINPGTNPPINISKNISSTDIEINFPDHPAAVQKALPSFRDMPTPGSILPAAKMTSSPVSESTTGSATESTAQNLTQPAIDSPLPQGRSDIEPSLLRSPFSSPQPIPSVTAAGKPQTISQPVSQPVSQPQTVQPFSDRIEVRSGVLPRQTATLVPVSPPLDRSAAWTGEQKAPAALPTIRVTIGRIEVRAISTPAPARPRAAPPPARLSLEDYLRLRSGGNP